MFFVTKPWCGGIRITFWLLRKIWGTTVQNLSSQVSEKEYVQKLVSMEGPPMPWEIDDKFWRGLGIPSLDPYVVKGNWLLRKRILLVRQLPFFSLEANFSAKIIFNTSSSDMPPPFFSETTQNARNVPSHRFWKLSPLGKAFSTHSIALSEGFCKKSFSPLFCVEEF